MVGIDAMSNRLCQRVGCEAEGIWIVYLRFQSDHFSCKPEALIFGSTITLCHEHRHHFKAEDLCSDLAFDSVCKVAKELGLKAPKRKETILYLMPIEDPKLN